MKTFSKSLLLLAVSLSLIVTGCGGSEFSTPRSTIETAQNALDNKNWEKLYVAFSQKWKKENIPRWQSTVKDLLRSSNKSYSITAENINELNQFQTFRVFLESLSRSKRTNRILDTYASTKFKIEDRKSEEATVVVDSRFPLPYEEGQLRKIQGHWKIDAMKR